MIKNCFKCNKEFYCTQSGFWSECTSKDAHCICFDCWKESFPNNNLIIKSVYFSLKSKEDMVRCYGKEAFAVDEL